MTAPIIDAEERQAALDPARSFIVQAPAGAGKTGLLTQRFLRLLATVEEPEEILAITFTRKAATEMRNRILGALQDAEAELTASDAYARQTAALAAAALERSRSRDWALSQNPGRLQIRTIDSLCHSLARRLPLLSRSGGPALAVDDASELYRLAARRTLALADDPEFAIPVTALLGHLDNNPARAGNLLAAMLARRDQWLRHLGGNRHQHLSRAKLETSLQRLVDETLEQVASNLPEEHAGEILELARFASRHLPEERRHDPLGRWDGREPGDQGGDRLTFWRAVAQLLLRKDASGWVIRKQANVDLGFPAPSKAKEPEEKARFKTAKDRYKDLVTVLSRDDALTDALCAIPDVPDPVYTEVQWSLLEQLPALLNLAYAQLRLIFAERGVTDHTEVNTAAGLALGTDESPTDLALALEYHLRHILVDEFQDTSRTQFDLLCRLTAGWQPDDGHSFFAVGDPMQSIYRFRQADVSLFIEARDRGLGDLPLDSLVLKTNFRSAAQVIRWVNDTFSAVFPARDDCDRGAVRYAAATAFHADAPQGGVEIHPLFDDGGDAEARLVADLIETAVKEGCKTIAVLARSRTHLHATAAVLSSSGKAFQAVEVQRLGERLAVRELRSLTRALVLPDDRAAWLAVLRAPWCGLTLADLTALVGNDQRTPVARLLADPERLARLSDDGARRAQRVRDVMQEAIGNRRRASLRRAVEATWLGLGGPACLRSLADLAAAYSYLDLVEALESASDLPLLGRLDESLDKLFAPPDPEAPDTIQLMTVHKAKGLEFDAVILPGLGRQPRGDDRELVQWLEWEGDDGLPHFVVAPIAETDAGDDPLERLLRNAEKTKQELEVCRLLYVAATRARKRLHLVGTLRARDDPDQLAPRRNTLLAPLWPVIGARFRSAMTQAAESHGDDDASATESFPPLIRATETWLPPRVDPVLRGETAGRDAFAEPEYLWAGSSARHIGTLVHRYLERMALDGLEQWDAARIQAERDAICRGLDALAVPEPELEQSADRVIRGLTGTLADERGRWILAPRTDARSEYALTTAVGGEPHNLVIDRTFIDDDGTRWIIDYKTGTHEGGRLEEFLDREQDRYRAQLEGYADVMALTEPDRRIRLGLYFPLLGAWREWPREPAVEV